MARPKNKQPIQRTHDIHIRCSEMEYEIVSGYAESAGLPTSTYIRKCFLKEAPSSTHYIVADTSEIHQLVTIAAGIGNNLNQITRYLHSGGKITVSIVDEIKNASQRFGNFVEKLFTWEESMAILKQLRSKNADYGAVIDYLKYQHDEFHLVPILDENGNSMLRDEFYFDGLNCNPEAFDLECELLNQQYHKNQRYDEIKCHHYIISHDPMDVADHGLTGEQAQAIGMEYAKANFPGHQALVCTHTDGSNNSGNIHTHIIINSLRKEDIASQPYTERAIDCKAGYKHHLTKEYLRHLQSSLMDICQREGLYQVDLLSPAAERITQQEYHAQRRGQLNLDMANMEIMAEGIAPMKTKF